MKTLCFLIVCLLCGVGMPAQEAQTILQQHLEVRAEDSEEAGEEDSDALQQLQHFKNHPLNLNTATPADLQNLLLLTDLQIAHFLRYRSLLGPLINIYELQAVPTWDIPTIAKVLPFVTVAQPLDVKGMLLARLKGGNHYLMSRFGFIPEKQKGFDRAAPGHYLGSRLRILLKHRYTYKSSLQYGFTGEKDSGEPMFNGAQKGGFDFYSAHFFARDVGPFTSVALGDFTVNFGQGLMQWQTPAFGKGAEVINVKRQSPVLKPYTGVAEYAFNRGAGVTFARGHFEATAFVSRKKISGNTAKSTTSGGTVISSLLLSGLHRTGSEIDDRNNAQQTSWGANLRYNSPMAQLGLNAVRTHLSRTLERNSEPYNRFALAGSHWFHYGADYGITYRNSHFFGELATNGSGLAMLNGVLVAAHPKADIAVVHRHIAPSYASLMGNAFTEATFPSNERGVYTGVVLRVLARLSIAMYADHFTFPFLKYRVNAPSGGTAYLAQLVYNPNKNMNLTLRFRSGKESSNSANGNVVIPTPVTEARQGFRVNLIYRLAPDFTLKARTEMLWRNNKENEREEGFLLYTEGDYTISPELSVNLRLLFFDTDNYNSRLYAYESDVLSAASILPYFNSGFRYYGNISYSHGKRWTLWARWAQTRYRNVLVIGSGQEEIAGSVKSEIKFQVRYSFN